MTEERENRELDEKAIETDLGERSDKGSEIDRDPGLVQELGSGRGSRKERVGLVVSDKPEKTAVVSVEALVQHPLYKKRIRRSKRFMVHDERNEARVGDTVRIVETRPISARKCWRLARIVSRAE